VTRADSGSCDLRGVGSEVAVQKVVGITDVTVAVVVVGTKSCSVCIGNGVTAKQAAVWTNQKIVSQSISTVVKCFDLKSRIR